MSLLNGLLAGKKPYHPLGLISLKSDVTFYHNSVFKAVTVNLIRARSEYLKLVILFRCRFVYSEKSKLALREDFATLREPFKIGSRGLFWIIMVQNVRHPYFTWIDAFLEQLDNELIKAWKTIGFFYAQFWISQMKSKTVKMRVRKKTIILKTSFPLRLNPY